MSVQYPEIHAIEAEDYVIYSVGSRIKALSRDPAYKTLAGSDFVTVLNAALDERELVGGTFKILESFDHKGTVNVPDLTNKDFEISGLGAHNTMLTGATGLTGKMFSGDRTAWGSPQYATFLKMHDLGLDPNNLGTGVIEAEYMGINLDRLYIVPNVPSGNEIIGRIGGSSGPSNINYIGTLEMRYITSVRNNVIFDVWVDNILVDTLSIVTNPNDASKPLWYSPGGTQTRINSLTYFQGGTGDLGSLLNMGSTPTSIGLLQTIVGAGNHPTIDGIFRSGGAKITCEHLLIGEPLHTPYYDTLSKKVTILGQYGGLRTVSGGSTTAKGAGTAYHAFESMTDDSATVWNRSKKVEVPFIVNSIKGFIGTAPGAGETKVFTLMKGAAQTALTFSIGEALKAGEDTAHEVEYAVGDYIAMEVVGSGGAAAASIHAHVAEVNYLYRT